jgi:aconitate hydratase
VRDAVEKGTPVNVKAIATDGTETDFAAVPRVDTPQEAEYFRNGGILPYVLRQLLQ